MATRAAAAKPRSKTTAKTKPVEYNILLTATLCLLAFGAVMVYSASSAKDALRSTWSAI
jgi:cell division protein FtsW (lipid II flippase)